MDDPRKEWLEKRRKGCGASDAAAILGLAKKSRVELWGEKTGRIPEDDLQDLEFVQWGNILEEPIAQEVARRTGYELLDPGRFEIVFSKDHPFMHCTLDRIIRPIDARGCGTLSIKCAGEYNRADWEDEPPLWAQAQAQQEMLIHEFEWGLIAPLVGGNKLLLKPIVRNTRFCIMLVESVEEFWAYVQKDEPPPADGTDSTREALRRLYPTASGESIELPLEAYTWAVRLRQAKEQEKEAKANVQLYGNLIQSFLRGATLGLLPPITEDTPADVRMALTMLPVGFEGYTLKNQHRDGYPVAACDFRVMREQIHKTTSLKWRK